MIKEKKMNGGLVVKKALILILTGAALCACKKSKPPASTPSVQPSPVTTATLSLTPTQAIPVPTNQIPIPTYASGDMPLSAEYFSGTAFLEWLSEAADLDKNGILSQKERDAVREIRIDPSVNTSVGETISGFGYFQNLAYVTLPKCAKAVFSDCLKLIGISGNETDSIGELVFENCPNLVSCGTLLHAARNLSVKNCPGLRYAYSLEAIDAKGEEDVWKFEGVKNLEIYGKSENLPARIYADAAETTFTTYNCGGMEWTADERFTVGEDGQLLIDGQERIVWTDAEEFDFGKMTTAQQLVEKMKQQGMTLQGADSEKNIRLLSYSLKNGVAYVVENQGGSFVAAVSPDGVCTKYESIPEWKCRSVGDVPVSAEYFGSEQMCKYLRENADRNQDGILTPEERMAVTKIVLIENPDTDDPNEIEKNAQVEFSEYIKGMDLFPNLTLFSPSNADNVILINVPKVESFGVGMTTLSRALVENCNSLQLINYYNCWGKGESSRINGHVTYEPKYRPSLTVRGCVKLLAFQRSETNFSNIEMIKVPRLGEQGDLDFYGYGMEEDGRFILDADATINFSSFFHRSSLDGVRAYFNENMTQIATADNPYMRVGQNLVFYNGTGRYRKPDFSEEHFLSIPVKDFDLEDLRTLDRAAYEGDGELIIQPFELDYVNVETYSPNRGVTGVMRGKYRLLYQKENQTVEVGTYINRKLVFEMKIGEKPVILEITKDISDYIPIKSDVFGNDYFCEKLREFDTDKDGYLSFNERLEVESITDDSVTGLNPVSQGDMKGFELFPNLKKLRIERAGEVTVQNCPKLEYVEICDGEVERFYLGNCDLLKTIVCDSTSVNLQVSACERLEEVRIKETDLRNSSFRGTPKLHIVGEDGEPVDLMN